MEKNSTFADIIHKYDSIMSKHNSFSLGGKLKLKAGSHRFFVSCLMVMALLLPCHAFAGMRGDQLVERADSLYGVQQYKEALRVASEALPLVKDTESEADCLNLLAIINIRLSDYEEAARYAKQCYAIDERSGDPDVMSSSLNTLAAIYMGANQLKEAEQYVLKGIEMARKADNPARQNRPI